MAEQSVRRFIRNNSIMLCSSTGTLSTSRLFVWKEAENLIFVEIELGLNVILNNHLKYHKKLQEFCYDYHMSQL